MKKIMMMAICVALTFCFGSFCFASEEGSVVDYFKDLGVSVIAKEWADTVNDLENDGTDTTTIGEINLSYNNMMTYCGNSLYSFLEAYNEQHMEALQKAEVADYYTSLLSALSLITTEHIDFYKYTENIDTSSNAIDDISHSYDVLETYIGNFLYDYLEAYNEKHIELINVDPGTYYGSLFDAFDEIVERHATAITNAEEKGLSEDAIEIIDDAYDTIETYIGNAIYRYNNQDVD